jgi:hypothetical protein
MFITSTFYYFGSSLDLKQHQVDYTQAFPQAPLDDPMYMQMPQGWYLDQDGNLLQHTGPTFHERDHYIQLKCNLYGCKQVAHNWFCHLTYGKVFVRAKLILVSFSNLIVTILYTQTIASSLLKKITQLTIYLRTRWKLIP